MRKRRGAVIAGGGTGGHIVPSLQIARALVARGHPEASVELYGSRRGQEAALWPGLEFPFTLLPGRGLRRSIRPDALWANAGAVLGLLRATVASVTSFVARRPRVVVVVGGYASFPAGVAALLTRVPMVLVNTDSVPGAVNALLGRFAAVNAVAFPTTRLPRAQVTGTPVRPELASLDRSETGRAQARTALGLPKDRRMLAAFGGLARGPTHQRRRGRPGRALVGSGRSLLVPGGRPSRLRPVRPAGAAGAAGAGRVGGARGGERERERARPRLPRRALRGADAPALPGC
jgi:hypothetical protein